MTQRNTLHTLLLLTASFIFSGTNDAYAQTIPKDKVKHATVSIVIGIVTYDFYRKNTQLTDNQAKLAAFAATLAVGAVKELSDSEFSWEDMAANTIGTGLGINIEF